MRASGGYTAFGLVSGVFYREYSRFCGFDTSVKQTQLRTLHTHSFTLGTMFTLIVLLLEKSFNLSSQKSFKKFYSLYHSGLGITLICMLIQGTLVTSGKEKNFYVTWAAGLGHALVGAGFYYFFLTLSSSVNDLRKR